MLGFSCVTIVTNLSIETSPPSMRPHFPGMIPLLLPLLLFSQHSIVKHEYYAKVGRVQFFFASIASWPQVSFPSSFPLFPIKDSGCRCRNPVSSGYLPPPFPSDRSTLSYFFSCFQPHQYQYTGQANFPFPRDPHGLVFGVLFFFPALFRLPKSFVLMGPSSPSFPHSPLPS